MKYIIEGTEISSPEGFRDALGELVRVSNFNHIGTTKPHLVEKVKGSGDKVDGGETYLTAQFRMPGVTALNIDGATVYSKNVNFKFDAFMLKTDIAASSTTPAKAATANADSLQVRFRAKQTPVS